MATTEERLAALEAKMAQLTDTTPTEYYTHQYSGEEIDAATGRALTGGALDTSVTNVSNQLGTFVRPNLLDNWYFGRPVNQRGQTEYTGEWIYTIDRWELSDGGGTLTVQDGSIIYASASYLFQPIDSDISKQLAGKTLTISFLYADGTLDIGTSKIASSWDSWTVFLDAGNARLVGVGNGRLWVLNTETGKAIVAAKLELGPTQTLAHQDAAGNWVLNEVPDYGEQLRRCQRYAIDLHGPTNYGVLGSGVARRTDRASIFCPLPVSMRVTPVATFGGSLTLASNADAGRGYVVTAVNVDHINSNGITLNVDTAGLTISTVYQLWRQGDASAHILLSADL